MKKLILFTFLQVFSLSLFAQSTRGTEFWFAYLENIDLIFNGPPSFFVQIHAEETTDGQIQVPATGLTIDFTATGGEITQVELPDAIWYSEGTEIAVNKGVRVVADLPVSVTALHYRPYFSEASLVLPADLLGDTYLPTCYVDDQDFAPTASFVICSTTDGDEIEITPRALTEGLRPADVPFTITLDRGQIYQVRSQGDLTGSSIRSLNGNPLAVFSGARRAYVEDCGSADSHLWDQAMPLPEWGSEYYFVPFKDQGGDIVKMVAAEDNTSVFFDCDEEVVLNSGESYRVKLEVPVVISSSGPISVAQFNSSQDCNPSNIGDPNMLQLLPVDRQNNEARFESLAFGNGVVAEFFSKHFVNIVMPLNGVADLTLDGVPIPAVFSTFPGNSAYAFAQVEVDPGTHFLKSETPFYCYSYGFGEFDAYTYHLGYEAIVPLTSEAFAIVADGVPCVDSLWSFQLDSASDLAEVEWFIDGEVVSTEQMFNFTFSEAGMYDLLLQGFDQAGCPVKLQELLEIEACDEECEADFPNIFTPNGDGRNDSFRLLFNCEPSDFTLRIFSRWGELVFETNDPNQSWDGTFQGQPFPGDVLVWLANYVPANEAGPVVKYGEVILLR